MLKLLLVFLIPFFIYAQTFPDCSINTAAHAECKTNISNLKPLQPNVGQYVINMTYPASGTVMSFEKKCANGTFEDDLIKRGASISEIAGIIGPNGAIYLINGHHHSYALNLIEHNSKSTPCTNYDGHVYVFIVDNQSHLSYTEFENYILKHNYAWLYDNHFNKITFTQLPTTIGAMGNDVERSIIKLVQDGRCNDKHPLIDNDNPTSFLQFIWGSELYSIVQDKYFDLNEKNTKKYAIDAYNIILEHYNSKFINLPGANLKPDYDYVCEQY